MQEDNINEKIEEVFEDEENSITREEFFEVLENVSGADDENDSE
jgi:hypothetical protein